MPYRPKASCNFLGQSIRGGLSYVCASHCATSPPGIERRNQGVGRRCTTRATSRSAVRVLPSCLEQRPKPRAAGGTGPKPLRRAEHTGTAAPATSMHHWCNQRGAEDCSLCNGGGVGEGGADGWRWVQGQIEWVGVWGDSGDVGGAERRVPIVYMPCLRLCGVLMWVVVVVVGLHAYICQCGQPVQRGATPNAGFQLAPPQHKRPEPRRTPLLRAAVQRTHRRSTFPVMPSSRPFP